MEDKNDHHNDRDQDLFKQRIAQGSESFINQARSVVERHNRHLADRAIRERLPGQPGRYLLDHFLYVLDRRQRIAAIAHDDHTAHRFRAAFVQGSATKRRSPRHGRHILHINRDVFVDLDDRVFNVFNTLDETKTTDHVLDFVHFDHSGAYIDVRHLDGLEDLVEPHTIGPHGVRVHVDLIFLNEAADGSDFGYAIDRL